MRVPDHGIFEGDTFRIVLIKPRVGVGLIGKDLEVIHVAKLL